MLQNRGQVPAVGRGGAAGRGGGVVRGRGGGRGGGRALSAAQMLLQKASTQLRGERVPIKQREEDELASYLKSLTQKTTQQAKAVSYEEYGDISISSGADAMTPRAARTPSPAIGAGSKFLKKKVPAPDTAAAPAVKKASAGGAYGVKPASSTFSSERAKDDDDGNDDDDDEVAYLGAKKQQTSSAPSAQKAGPKLASTSAPPVKRGGFQMSSALTKATALANKITQRSLGSAPVRKPRSTLMDSDTDESLGAALRGSAAGAKSGGKGSRPGSAASDRSVGHDGKKFMKKRGAAAEAVTAETVKASGRKSPARPALKEQPAKRTADQRGGVKKSHVSTVVAGSGNIYLTSEEESLAEFIQGLSGSDESRRSRQKKGQNKQQQQHRQQQALPKFKRQASSSPSPSPSPNRRNRRQSPSPSPSSKPKGRSGSFKSRSVLHRGSSQESDSITDSHHHEKIMIADSISLDDPLEINLMDANTLGPIVLNTPEPASFSELSKRSSRARPSPFKQSRSPSPSKKKSPEKVSSKKKTSKKKSEDNKKASSVFESFGVHSIEDLLGGGTSDKENTDSEIPTEPIKSKRRLHDDSISMIGTEIGSRATPHRQVSYSEDFEASISERIGEADRDKGRRGRKASSASSVATQYSDEETGMDYTEDFASETLSMARDSEEDKSSTYRYSDDEDTTQASESIIESRAEAKPERDRKVRVETHSVEIQTAAPAGLSYQWLSHTGVSVLGPSLGLGSVDPTPIAATVINPDALETMTSYSPATLAIHEMLKQQIDLIQQFAHAHNRLYHSLTDSNPKDYTYTTLQGTKEFIKKHRKPRLTMKQALKMVAQEMGERA